MLLYALTIFVSAFLLFQIEPMMGKIILPWFGGSAAVWTTCLLFFQTMLLLGYLYAHGSVRSLRPRSQAVLHVALLGLSLLLLPVVPKQGGKMLGADDPTLRILGLLTATIGLPFVLLSTTGPLLQAWYASEPDSFPYWLYALSNAGSMLALLSYPGLVEPIVATRQQLLGWSIGYAGFVVLCAVAALRLLAVGRPTPAGSWLLVKTGPSPTRSQEPGARSGGEAAPGWQLHLLWMALAACASILLLAVTNHLSQNVAPIPFLWVLPLSLYLLTFILCFARPGWHWKKLYLPIPIVALASMALAVTENAGNTSVKVIIPLFAVGLFVSCLVCHGELARLKPHPQHLTSFYLMISLGGALGGVFVGLLAPHLLNDFDELPIGIAACAVLASFTLYRGSAARRWNRTRATATAFAVALVLFLAVQAYKARGGDRFVGRNFYGCLRVSDSGPASDEEALRTLTNGTITHGEQFLNAKYRRDPTTYYGPDSGVGRAIRAGQEHPHERVGVIGLGTGTLACYGRSGDRYRFYDINPLVIRVAREQFTFLRDCPARLEVVPGDARLSLEREPAQSFDVLAVDAFSSDSIPVHLLTREAFALYFRHLNADGVLAVHVSNRYLDLAPVVARTAESLGKEARLVTNDEDDENDILASEWVLVANRRGYFAHPLLRDRAEPITPRKRLRTWTDDYSNLFQILK
jgi:SAM-dependent methyltransferase